MAQKPYLVFAFYFMDAYGGTSDFKESFATYKEARHYADTQCRSYDNVEIVVYDGKRFIDAEYFSLPKEE